MKKSFLGSSGQVDTSNLFVDYLLLKGCRWEKMFEGFCACVGRRSPKTAACWSWTWLTSIEACFKGSRVIWFVANAEKKPAESNKSPILIGFNFFHVRPWISSKTFIVSTFGWFVGECTIDTPQDQTRQQSLMAATITACDSYPRIFKRLAKFVMRNLCFPRIQFATAATETGQGQSSGDWISLESLRQIDSISVLFNRQNRVLLLAARSHCTFNWIRFFNGFN